ncbi:unnamed protein product [Mytilus edulis]|uniref:Uncharacterized protein n=1 Tax=Mytilus edulis TaxID=6550 RepID=A0A8S3SN14_MYTED|nr:unnamed protein product [Mytilus edulis]
MNTESENQHVLYAFHSLENNLIDCHLQYSEKIDHLATLIIMMVEKLILQAKEQEEIRNKNMELSKINKRLANIEEHVNKNSIEIARATSTIEKSVPDIRNPAYDNEQSEKLRKLKADNIGFQVGSNDLEDSTPEDVDKNMKRLILNTQRLVPGSNIIINAILPRFYRNAHSSKTYESKRTKCNNILSDLCNEYSLKFVKHENFVPFHFTDGIHLNHNDGIPLYVRNLKHVVNPLLGVINDQQNFENHQFPRQRNQQFRRENGNHFYKRPNRYDEENHQSDTYITGDKLDYIKDDSLDINDFAQTNLLPDEYRIDNCFNIYSCDKVVNGQGINLLDLSTSSSLCISNGRYSGDIMGHFTCMTSNGSSVVDYHIVSESLLSSVEYFKTHEFNYLSDHVKIEIFLKCMQREYNFDIFENSNWSSYKSFKWDSQKSKLKLLDHLSDETVLNNILNFEMQTFSNDQRGVDDETNKLTTILCNLAENSCVIKRKNFKKSKPKNKQPWSDNAITDLKHQINAIGRNIKANPFDKTYKTRYFNLLKTFKKMIKQKKS